MVKRSVTYHLAVLSLVLLVLTVAWSAPAVAAAQWYDDKERGWFWRELPPAPPAIKPPEEPVPVAAALPASTAIPTPVAALQPPTATQRMEAVRAELEEAKNAAILTPTPDVVNMALMGVPLYLLYEAGIVILHVLGIGGEKLPSELDQGEA